MTSDPALQKMNWWLAQASEEPVARTVTLRWRCMNGQVLGTHIEAMRRITWTDTSSEREAGR
jgi:hypothetical protein